MAGHEKHQAGDLDPEFNGGHVDLSHLGYKITFMNNVRPTSDGVLLTAHGLTGSQRAISKFTRQGKLDTGFRGKGYFNLDAQQSLQVGEDDSFYLADTQGATEVFIQKFTPDGEPDTRYGDGGTARVDFAGAATQPRISSMAGDIERGRQRGTPLNAQANGGIEVNSVPEIISSVLTVLDGTALYLITAGKWADWVDYMTIVARVDEDGQLDAAYGRNGFVLIDGPEFGLTFPHNATLQQQPGGGTALLLQFSNPAPLAPIPDVEYRNFIVRLDTKGEFDQQFGKNGSIIHMAVGAVPNPKFFVDDAGTIKVYNQPNSSSVVVAGFTKHGQKDPVFNNGGVLTITSGSDVQTAGFQLKSSGSATDYRFVHYGGAFDDAGVAQNVIVYRNLEKGSPDPAFGAGGLAVINDVRSGFLMAVEFVRIPGSKDLYTTVNDKVYRVKGG